MRKNRLEYALGWSNIEFILPDWVIVAEIHEESVGPSFPRSSRWTRDLTDPFQHINASIRIFSWLSNEPERVVAPPFFPLFLKSIQHNFVCLFFIKLLLHYQIINSCCLTPFK
jgi:hypothetical protein